MLIFWGGIALQVVGAGIWIAIVQDLSKQYAYFGGGNVVAGILAAGATIFGVTFMLKGLREYFLGEITATIIKISENTKPKG